MKIARRSSADEELSGSIGHKDRRYVGLLRETHGLNPLEICLL